MSVCEDNMKRVRRPDTKGSGRSGGNLAHHTQDGVGFSRWQWGALRLHGAFQHAVPTAWTPS